MTNKLISSKNQIFQGTRRFTAISTYTTRQQYASNTILEDEIVILKSSVNDRAEPILTKPLKPGACVSYKKLKDIIKHDEIIGKQIRNFVRAKNGVNYRIHRPTLAEYTDNAPRVVTPIYSQDANLIVSLLDLHPTVPGTQAEKLEIFEAGTGHGALTLHLARAVHAANTLPPEIPPDIFLPNQFKDSRSENYESWRSQRRAIIHSLDNQENHSRHAAATIKKYRNGIYFPHINFYTGSIEEFFSEKLAQTSNLPFLDHAILDLPSPDSYMKNVSDALKENGNLLVFVPSITQISKVSLAVRSNGTPLILDSVLEIGGMIGTGGREWDVRPVKPRALLKAESVEEKMISTSTEEKSEVEQVFQSDIQSYVHSEKPDDEIFKIDSKGWEMVCRPKVGLRTTGGGFLGIWRKVLRQLHDVKH